MATQYSVRNIPTLILVDNRGTELKRMSGVQTKDNIKNWYNG